MRDFLIVMIVLGSVPLIIVRPQIGILIWFWLSMMNPHKWAWGYAQEFRVALVAGIAALLAWLISQEPKLPPRSPIVYTLAAFTFWVSLAALFAIHPEVAIPKWEEIIKILLMTFVTMCIVQSQERIQQLVWVITVSIGIYGVKGGLFSVATGGNYRVWGPDDTFISDNNSLALALIVILPLLQYLRTTATNRWVKFGLFGSMGLTIVSILGSYSRGALLGLGVTLAMLLLKSRRALATVLVMVGVFGAALYLLPDQWAARMSTIQEYEQDASTAGRFDAWNFAFRLARDHPFLGGGQLVGTDDRLFKQYVPTAVASRAAHSIYFEVLGETGFVGLGLFLLLLFFSFRGGSNIIKSTRNRPDLAWARSLAAMLQVAFVGYAAAGAFLSLGFFDLYYALIAVMTATQVVVRRELAKPRGAAAEPARTAASLNIPATALLPTATGRVAPLDWSTSPPRPTSP
jgi:putative inorganic carbon (hco3(-)) transporter